MDSVVSATLFFENFSFASLSLMRNFILHCANTSQTAINIKKPISNRLKIFRFIFQTYKEKRLRLYGACSWRVSKVYKVYIVNLSTLYTSFTFYTNYLSLFGC